VVIRFGFLTLFCFDFNINRSTLCYYKGEIETRMTRKQPPKLSGFAQHSSGRILQTSDNIIYPKKKDIL
jgi:hypothetical protein